MKANYMNYFKDGNCYQWDKDNNIFIITPTKIDPELEFCLDKKMMETFLKFDSPKLKLGKTLQVQENQIKVNLKLTETPLVIPTMEVTSTTYVEVSDLITACNYSAKTDKKPVLTGVFIGRNYIGATDSFSGYFKEIESNANITLPVEFISLLSGADGEIEISSNKNNAKMQVGDSTVIGRLLDGEYPALENIASYQTKTETKNIEFNVKEFLKLISFASDEKDFVILSNNKFKIDGLIPFEAELKDFDLDREMIFAVSYLKTVLKDLKTEKATFCYVGEKRPVFINQKFILLPLTRML